MGHRTDVEGLLKWYLELEKQMPEVVSKDDCKDKHEKLETDVEKAIETATASVEARIKIWILMSIIPILGAFIYFLVELGSYRNQVDSDAKRIEKLEQVIDHIRYDRTHDGGSGGRVP